MVGMGECHDGANGGEVVRLGCWWANRGRIEPGRGAGDPLETDVERGRPLVGGRVAGGVQSGVVDFSWFGGTVFLSLSWVGRGGGTTGGSCGSVPRPAECGRRSACVHSPKQRRIVADSCRESLSGAPESNCDTLRLCESDDGAPRGGGSVFSTHSTQSNSGSSCEQRRRLYAPQRPLQSPPSVNPSRRAVGDKVVPNKKWRSSSVAALVRPRVVCSAPCVRSNSRKKELMSRDATRIFAFKFNFLTMQKLPTLQHSSSLRRG